MTEPAVTADAPKASFVQNLTGVFRVLISPGEVYAEQQPKPAWFTPWIVISVLSVIVGLLSMPYTARVMELSIQARGQGQEIPAAAMQIGRIIALIAMPLIALIASLIGAFVMWMVLMLGGEKVRFRGLMSVAMYAKILIVLQLIVQWAILKARGSPAEAISSITDAQPSIGLDLLLPADGVSPFLRALLGAINPLTIWACIIMAVGLMVTERQTKQRAWTAVLVSFTLGVLLAAAMAGRSAG